MKSAEDAANEFSFLNRIARGLRTLCIAAYALLDRNNVAVFAAPDGVAGYQNGTGGTVTQITSRATTVVLSKATGQITTTASSLAAATIVTFTVTNTLVTAKDVVNISKVSGDVDTHAWVNSVADGSFTVSLRNTHDSGADTTAFVFNFAIVKGQTA